MPNKAKLAEEFAAAFEERERNNGDKFVCLKDGSPEWMSEITHAAHGDMGPDDFRYRMISEVATSIDEVLTYDADSDLDDERHERLDGLVPIYNWDRLKWLSSRLDRAYYVEDAVKEGRAASGRDFDLFEALGAGIFEELGEVWQAVADGLEAEAEDDEEDEEDDEEDGESA